MGVPRKTTIEISLLLGIDTSGSGRYFYIIRNQFFIEDVLLEERICDVAIFIHSKRIFEDNG